MADLLAQGKIRRSTSQIAHPVVLVYSFDWNDHLRHLKNVLRALQEAGLTLKLSKCEFAKPSVKFLGYQVGSEKSSVIKSK